MKDIFDSNGYLPLHYKIKREDCIPGKTDANLEGKPQKRIVDSQDLRPFRSVKYQTDMLIHTGLSKPISNLHN